MRMFFCAKLAKRLIIRKEKILETFQAIYEYREVLELELIIEKDCIKLKLINFGHISTNEV